jgi:hypothetical protein
VEPGSCLGNQPELLFSAPAPPPFATADDFNRAVRHDFMVDLKVGFKVYSLGISRPRIARRGSPDAIGHSMAAAVTTGRKAAGGYRALKPPSVVSTLIVFICVSRWL